MGKGGDAARMLPAISLGIHGVEQGAGIGFHIVGLDVGIQDILDLLTRQMLFFKKKIGDGALGLIGGEHVAAGGANIIEVITEIDLVAVVLKGAEEIWHFQKGILLGGGHVLFYHIVEIQQVRHNGDGFQGFKIMTGAGKR